MAVWRYKRREKLPRTKPELEAARIALLDAAAAKDDTFTEIKSAATTVAGQPAVQVRARATIDGRKRVLRSTHIYAHGAEIIVDAFSGSDTFRGVDAQVFRPLLRSLKVGKPE